jgi:hypothetical protein
MSDIVVLPWIGANYKTPRLFSHRTMILGESNYTTPENFTPMLVRDCVDDAITGKDPGGLVDSRRRSFGPSSGPIQR